MNTLELIKEAKFCFYGYGRENKALINYLRNHGILKIADCFDQQEISRSEDHIRTISAEQLLQSQLIFKAPGVSLHDPLIKSAISKGIIICSPSQIFFELNKSFKIAVTGSKGKSTFTKLLTELLSALGLRSIAAGNIGVPLMDICDQAFDVVIAELSSYQLASLEMQVDYAVVTSLFPEHLSWHGTIEDYYLSKLRLSDAAKSFFVFDPELEKQITKLKPQAKTKLLRYQIFDGEIALKPEEKVKITNPYFAPEHLTRTLAGALSLLAQFAAEHGIDWLAKLSLIEDTIRNFIPLPHRLQAFYQSTDLVCVDDSISTAPEAVVAALKAWSERRIFLFVGGYCKGTSQQVLIDYLNQHPEIYPFCYSITGKNIFDHLQNQKLGYFENLQKALDAAWKLKQTICLPAVMLLSPGAASFDQFRDFEDRGQFFQKIVLAKLNESGALP